MLAVRGLKNVKTDMLCKPWYYGTGPTHVPNNVDRTTTPKDGKKAPGAEKPPPK